MANALHLQILSQAAAIGQDRIVWATLIGTIDILASGDSQMMRQLSATLGDKQIVITILLIQVGTLGIPTSLTAPKGLGLGELLACLWINLAQTDEVSAIAQEVTLTILEIE